MTVLRTKEKYPCYLNAYKNPLYIPTLTSNFVYKTIEIDITENYILLQKKTMQVLNSIPLKLIAQFKNLNFLSSNRRSTY